MTKFKSNKFCVATEGATTDGRTITAAWIQEMADTFDRKTYGARVWLEHMRGMLPDSPFKAYGDVMSLEARKKDDGKWGLFAEIDPTSELVQINKARQKIYTSIEVNPDFAGTGKAYLQGLAVTDSPASLGTDVLAFSQKNPDSSFLSARKLEKGNLFTVAEEADMEFTEVDETPAFSEKIKTILTKFRKHEKRSDDQFSELLDAVEQIAEQVSELSAKPTQSETGQAALAKLTTDLATLQKAFDDFRAEVQKADASENFRQPATGGSGVIQTDC